MHSSYFHREDLDSSLHERMVFIPFMKGNPRPVVYLVVVSGHAVVVCVVGGGLVNI